MGMDRGVWPAAVHGVAKSQTQDWATELNWKKKKNNNEMILFAATWMDPEMIILSEVSPRKTDAIWGHLYVDSKK